MINAWCTWVFVVCFIFLTEITTSLSAYQQFGPYIPQYVPYVPPVQYGPYGTGGFDFDSFNRQMQDNMQKQQQQFQDQMNQMNKQLAEQNERMQNQAARTSILQGKGGTTLIQTKTGNTYLVSDGQQYTCNDGSYIIPSDSNNNKVGCDGKMVQVDTPDQCLIKVSSTSYSNINDDYCFGQNTQMVQNNGNVSCNGGILVNLKDIISKCGTEVKDSDYATATYNANSSDSIPIPNSFKCDSGNLNDGTCVITTAGI